MKRQISGRGKIVFTNTVSPSIQEEILKHFASVVANGEFVMGEEYTFWLEPWVDFQEEQFLKTLTDVVQFAEIKEGSVTLYNEKCTWRYHYCGKKGWKKETAIFIPQKGRNMTDLTNQEIKELITALFAPERMTKIQRHKRDDSITCNVEMKWRLINDEGEEESYLDVSEIEISDPFVSFDSSIIADFSLEPEDFWTLKQFCIAKGVGAIFMNNPFWKENIDEED